MLAMDYSGAGGRKTVPVGDFDSIGLIEQIAGGDQQALARLYDRTSRIVYSLALRILNNPADAEEVTVDVYSQIWRSASEYVPDRSSPTTWLVMIARSRALDRLRSRDNRQGRETALEAAPNAVAEESSAEDRAWQMEKTQRVRKALTLLSADQRQALELAFFGGLSHSELAERLGQPLGTIKTRIRAGILKMRQALSAELGVAR